ncbi:MAG: biliverdin-producing heme oxygenase [Cyclobacteriaceae bacterium]|jgi:heme oxygenase|nr:biliverdin-producing heme oxygenase [Cyclobacteriaceae bacterium]
MTHLKDATSLKHKQAEKMPFNVRMFRGLLTKGQYLLYLNQQLQIFNAIETIGLPHDSLKRTEKVQADIDELKSQGHSTDLVLNSTSAYVSYLNSLSYEQILPHIYLNYMGIMFGGQMIKKAVPSTGRMYIFDDMQQTIQSIRAVQKDEWADEVNKGFDFTILLFEELETQCGKG